MKPSSSSASAFTPHELAGILLTMIQEVRDTITVTLKETMAEQTGRPLAELPAPIAAPPSAPALDTDALLQAIRATVAEEVQTALAAHGVSQAPSPAEPPQGASVSADGSMIALDAETFHALADSVAQTVTESMTASLEKLTTAKDKHSNPDATSDDKSETGGDGAYMDLIHLELVELLDRIQSTKSEVASLRPTEGATDQIMMATMELEAVVQATEQATSDILEAAEGLQNTVDLLRSPELSLSQIPGIAEHLEDAATNILMTCSFQDITGQRINAAVNTLLYVEESLSRIVELWGISAGTADAAMQRNAPDDDRPDKDLLHGPQMDGHGVSQDDIDKLFG
jgi:chemotaxis regulatin CheY-phosphate phosphatase CheZ